MSETLRGTVVLIEPNEYSGSTEKGIACYLQQQPDVAFEHAGELSEAKRLLSDEKLSEMAARGPIVAVVLESIAGVEESSRQRVSEFVIDTRRRMQELSPNTPFTVIGTSLLRRNVSWSDVPTFQGIIYGEARQRFHSAVREGLRRQSSPALG